MVKGLYHLVTFVASIAIIAFVSWEGYMQWPAIEATANQIIQKGAPAVQNKCECAPVCPLGGCANCECKKQCCPGH